MHRDNGQELSITVLHDENESNTVFTRIELQHLTLLVEKGIGREYSTSLLYSYSPCEEDPVSEVGGSAEEGTEEIEKAGCNTFYRSKARKDTELVKHAQRSTKRPLVYLYLQTHANLIGSTRDWRKAQEGPRMYRLG